MMKLDWAAAFSAPCDDLVVVVLPEQFAAVLVQPAVHIQSPCWWKLNIPKLSSTQTTLLNAWLLLPLVLFWCSQECFSAGYASFNMEQVQYSTTAGGVYPDMANKYDPKQMDRFSTQEQAKVRQAAGR
jgi:hypothetical protein